MSKRAASQRRSLAGIVGIAACAVLVLGLSVFRLNRQGAELAAQTQAAIARGETAQAILLARATAETAPSKHSSWGLETLARMGSDSMARGDDATALVAFRSLDGACQATSSLWSQHTDQRTRAREGLAQIAARKAAADSGHPETKALLGPERSQGSALSSLAFAACVILVGFALIESRRRPKTFFRVAAACALAGVGFACAGLFLS